MTRKIEKEIQAELDSLKKIGMQVEPEASTRLRYIIAEVDGSSNAKDIREAVDNMLVADNRALREFYKKITPDVKFETQYTCEKCEHMDKVSFSIGLNFFWPDARI